MQQDKIRALNDAFRFSIITPNPLGKVYMTVGIQAHGEPFGMRTLVAIASFDAFTEDIDPHGEHDMIRVVVDDTIVWAKIDFHDKADPDLSAENPSDAVTTERVMTLMLPTEC